jgi:hypothetical protein
MDTFRWLSTVVSMILGLGIARLLTGGVALFHARHSMRFDWIPLAWAFAVFIQQIGLWWSLEELATIVPKWSLVGFLMLVALVLVLFLAAALVMPPIDLSRTEVLRDLFEADGRWALLMLAAFNTLALFANMIFWHQPLMSLDVGLNALLAGLAVVTFVGRRPVQAVATVSYVAIVIVTIALVAPSAQ